MLLYKARGWDRVGRGSECGGEEPEEEEEEDEGEQGRWRTWSYQNWEKMSCSYLTKDETNLTRLGSNSSVSRHPELSLSLREKETRVSFKTVYTTGWLETVSNPIYKVLIQCLVLTSNHTIYNYTHGNPGHDYCRWYYGSTSMGKNRAK